MCTVLHSHCIIFKSAYFKWLAKIFCYTETHCLECIVFFSWILHIPWFILYQGDPYSNVKLGYIIYKEQMQLWAVLFLLTTAGTLYMFQTLSVPIIMSTKNCRNSHWCVLWVAVTTVFSTLDDGCRNRPKHVECTCSC